MATAYREADALAVALSVIPSLSRAVLNRIVQRAIERLDELDEPWTDLEPEEDCCTAGDDDPHGLTAFSLRPDGMPGDPADAEGWWQS